MLPTRPMRVLIVQGENDLGDLAEMTTGIMEGMGVDEFSDAEAFDLTDRNLTVVTEHQTIGPLFCSFLARQIERHAADIVFVDPLIQFAGINVSQQDQVTRFLRTQLNPVLKDSGAVLIGVHHTGKPKTEKGQQPMTVIDYAYSGLGSSDLVNWARAVMVLVPNGDLYDLKLAKRGRRAWATHPDGSQAMSVWLRHGRESICWEQVEAPEGPVVSSRENRKLGAPSKVKQLCDLVTSDLHSFLKDCPEEGAGKNQMGHRLEDWAATTHKRDFSPATCKRAVEALVDLGSLEKREGGKFHAKLTSK
jgi:hypothetical protein